MPLVSLALGGFGYYSNNTLDSLTRNPETGVAYNSRLLRYGPDFRLTITAPVSANLYTQILFGKDSNATGFGKEASWWGGFVQGEVKPRDDLIVYSRYDWIDGDRFDDTAVTINGVSGSIGPVDPRLWDLVAGAQYLIYDNLKLIAEYRHGVKDLGGVPANPQQLRRTLEDAGFLGSRLEF